MTRPMKLALGGLLLILLGWGGLLLVQRLQPYEEQIDHGPSPEARANEYLAAELFLRQQKISVRRADGLEVLKDLPAAGQVARALEGLHLVLEDRLAVVEQPADQRALPVVHAAGGDEPEQFDAVLRLSRLGHGHDARGLHGMIHG